MVLPLAGMAGMVASAAAGQYLGKLFDPITTYVTGGDPVKRANEYSMNHDRPNVIPPPELIMSLGRAGWITHEAAGKWLRWHGMLAAGPGEFTNLSNVWYGAYILGRNKPAAADVLSLWLRDDITAPEAHARLKEHGFVYPSERDLMMGMGVQPDTGLILELLNRGTIATLEAQSMLRRTGILEESHRNFLTDLIPPLNLGDVYPMFLRGMIDRPEAEGYLKRLGIREQTDRDRLLELTDYLPPVSDIIRFAIKDVFLPDFPGRAKMLEELGEQPGLMELMEAQGISDVRITDRQGETHVYNVPELYWLASFERPSPTQTYEMLHRLRPNRVQRYPLGNDPQGQPIFPRPIGMADVRYVLKDKDYDPAWRDELAAISYRPLGRQDTKRLYVNGVMGAPQGAAGWNRVGNEWVPVAAAETELREKFMDFGISQADAGDLGYELSLEWERNRGGVSRRPTGRLICRAYSLGAITRPQMVQRLRAAGFRPVEADALADNCDLEYTVGVLARSTAAVRTAYLTGRIDRVAAADQLATAGVNQVTIQSHLRLWDVELLARRREATAERMCGWVERGLLTREEMERRLTRMGWEREDVARISRHCVLGHLATAQRELERRAQAQAREVERLRRAQEGAQRRIEAEVRRRADAQRRAAERALQAVLSGRNPDHLRRWIRRGLVNRAQVRAALTPRGWLPVDVERWIVEAFGGVGG